MLIGYVRVSPRDHDVSLDAQHAALAGAGCTPGHIYSDMTSEPSRNWPGFQAALKAASAGDTLVVTGVDQLGANPAEAVSAISDLLSKDVNVRILDPECDTSTPSGAVTANVLSVLARWERELLAQRTRDGMAYARAQGRVAGPKPKLNEQQRQQAANLVAHGHSVAAVARKFGVSRQTIYRAIDSQKSV